jgi:hypothetical protein
MEGISCFYTSERDTPRDPLYREEISFLHLEEREQRETPLSLGGRKTPDETKNTHHG